MRPQLTQKELEKFYTNKKEMIWQYNTLYQIRYSRNIGKGEYYLSKVHTRNSKGMGVTRKGRFIAMTLERANEFY